MSLLTIDEYLRQPVAERLPYYQREGRLYHVMMSQQFPRPLMEEIFGVANALKAMSHDYEGLEFLSRLLRHKRAMLYFTQPSTRTFLSFLTACQLVGITTGEVQDPALSSEYKGESQEDAIRVFSSYFDLVIMRDPKPGFCEYIAYRQDRTGFSVPILNGGSGKDQHPTQALLDLYTMHRSFQRMGGISGKRYAFVGDLQRGRAVRSVMYLLANYEDLDFYAVAPKGFQISPDLQLHLEERGVRLHFTDQLNEVLPKVDCSYMTRIQDEYDLSGESGKIDLANFSLTEENVNLLPEHAIILHPLPRRQEISSGIDANPRAMYWSQLRNGVYIRAALLLYIFGKNEQLPIIQEKSRS